MWLSNYGDKAIANAMKQVSVNRNMGSIDIARLISSLLRKEKKKCQ